LTDCGFSILQTFKLILEYDLIFRYRS